VRRLYLWTIHWAATPYALWALFLLAFAESSFFPVPPDVLLIAMALGAPRRSLRFALLCTVGSVLGGVVGYGIGMFCFEAAGRPILEAYGYVEEFEQLRAQFGSHGGLVIFIAALTPIPYKVFTIAAGVSHDHVPLVVLVGASVVGRGLRFCTLGVLFRLFGRQIKGFIDRYFNLLTVAFVVLLVLGFLCVKLFGGQGEEPPPPGPLESRMGQPAMLSEEARRTLMDIARRTAEAAVRGEPLPSFDVQDPELSGHRGAFVTLRTKGQLRGCIGRFQADRPLWRVVRGMAVAAVREDARFFGMQLKPHELPELEVEVSVLSPLRRTDDPIGEIELGRHGVYVKRGFAAGCFLPQVATETGWSKEEFLANCCAGKGGMRPDAWKDADTEVYVFTADIIEEA
jgi:AmmeMemoRadiSam system protein A